MYVSGAERIYKSIYQDTRTRVDEKKVHTAIKEAKAQRLEVGSFNELIVS